MPTHCTASFWGFTPACTFPAHLPACTTTCTHRCLPHLPACAYFLPYLFPVFLFYLYCSFLPACTVHFLQTCTLPPPLPLPTCPQTRDLGTVSPTCLSSAAPLLAFCRSFITLPCALRIAAAACCVYFCTRARARCAWFARLHTPPHHHCTAADAAPAHYLPYRCLYRIYLHLRTPAAVPALRRATPHGTPATCADHACCHHLPPAATCRIPPAAVRTAFPRSLRCCHCCTHCCTRVFHCCHAFTRSFWVGIGFAHLRTFCIMPPRARYFSAWFFLREGMDGQRGAGEHCLTRLSCHCTHLHCALPLLLPAMLCMALAAPPLTSLSLSLTSHTHQCA